MTFFARFSNIYLEVNLSMIYTFLKQVKETYSYKWVRKTDHRILVIYGTEQYELPFQEKDHKVFLSIKELSTNEKTFALALNQLLFQARKNKLNLPSVTDKKRRKTKEIHKKQLSFSKKMNVIELEQGEASSTEEQTTNFVIQSEIDYLLMELCEAMQNQDQEKMTWCKDKLRELLHIKMNKTS